MNEKVKNAFEKLVGLKEMTRSTGQNTNKAQRTVMRSITPEELAEVAGLFRLAQATGDLQCETVPLTASEKAELAGE